MLISSFDEYYKLSFGKRPAEELYRIKDDPDCMNNLAKNMDLALVKRHLQTKMEELLRAEGDPRMLGNSQFFDTIEYVGPRKHAYSEWLKNKQ